MNRIGANERSSWIVRDGTVDVSRSRPEPRRIEIAASPQGVVFDAKRTACIVVDMQNDFCSVGGWLEQLGVDVSTLRQPIAPLSVLLPVLREAGIPVIFLNWGNRPDRANLPPGVLHVYDRDGTGGGIGDVLTSGERVLEHGSGSAALVDELVVAPEDLFVEKYRMTGFVDTELDSVLRNLDVSTLLFTGVNVDQCVLATFADAAALGYDCLLVEDCCATTSPAGCAEATSYNVAQCFGFVATSASILEGLAASRARLDPGEDHEGFAVVRAGEGVAHRISGGDSVKLVPLRRPLGQTDASVFLEIWDPGGSQPPNSHADSIETFFFLRGRAIAHCDGKSAEVGEHEFLVLQPRSVHRVENVGEGRLYAITTMLPDAGFAALVDAGPAEPLDGEDRLFLNSTVWRQ
jgi:nicotinamidase-related amidase/mannose-6-phosphate isomerase-like protein (cupin superfamily)